jgi:hypothetical protein
VSKEAYNRVKRGLFYCQGRELCLCPELLGPLWTLFPNKREKEQAVVDIVS